MNDGGDRSLDTLPSGSRVPSAPSDGRGVVVWHRDELRTADHPALTAAARSADTVLPLFVFDPAFYDETGLACDARLRFLHESLADLDEQYRHATDSGTGLSFAHGDPVEVLARLRDAGWDVFAARSPTGRYGRTRDERARDRADVVFVSGDGLVRGSDRTREEWADRVTAWFTDDTLTWDTERVTLARVPTELSPTAIEDAYDVAPGKRRVPTGGREAGVEALRAFTDRIESYPESISAPLAAREGASGLSPYLRFGCLSVREVYQHVSTNTTTDRAREMFTSRLYWNRHYKQKLEDWPGWLDTAANPVLAGFNADRYDSEYVTAWKEGRTGYPMVDAAMRCLRETGWLNFRMRAMCVSVYFHILQQPWKPGADWYHHHLIDSDPAINYTQWQAQCGLVGKPTLRLYNPRKQVRDHDPDGEWIRRWVPELTDLPDEHLPRPEHTPVHVQESCGVELGETYPYPIAEYESAKETFWRRYNAVKPEAAARLGDEEIARRVSLSGGIPGAKRIADEHGTDAEGSRDRDGDTPRDSPQQTDLTRFG
ncbi:deoxyribodipyrimidine photolyase [Halobacteriales archaeon SW_8_65_20]|nr:MAG: deoxyribodipyrimidine photolyase [Halobacteriales archaeon SW_8_65_20]